MLKLQYFDRLMRRVNLLGKMMTLGKTEDRRRETEDEMFQRHRQPNGHEFEHTLGDGEGGKPAALQFVAGKEADMT